MKKYTSVNGRIQISKNNYLKRIRNISNTRQPFWRCWMKLNQNMYQFRTISEYTDSNISDKSGFTYFVERSYKNKFLFFFTFGWKKIGHFDSYEKAQRYLQYCKESSNNIWYGFIYWKKINKKKGEKNEGTKFKLHEWKRSL